MGERQGELMPCHADYQVWVKMNASTWKLNVCTWKMNLWTWKMNMFHIIPDVDLLEQIYDSATVRLAANDAESATITFDTGVAQGSITYPQLFNIFINALLRMLTANGQNQRISHGLQISKDQDDSSQDADHGYHFNNIGFIDDISIFAETPEGMQILLDVVQKFTTWCGMEINVFLARN